ncbi:MAG: ParA family protein [bacterium]|nr:ParA family protein [bacterium]MDZ4296605.1 ParA family protein [Patescibacteria group bacterium]
MAKIIAIASHKGGSGRTTTAVNLGAYLAAHGRRTLVVDLDPQGNATMGLGAVVGRDDLSAMHVLLGDVSLADVARPTALFGLDLVPATLNLGVFEERGSSLPEQEFTLAKLLRSVSEGYRYIVIDTPPSRGMLWSNALVAAERVLIPVQCEYYALRGVEQFLELLSRHEERFQMRPAVSGMVLTMYERWQKLSQEMQKTLRERFPEYVFDVVIPRSVQLAEAPQSGKAIVQYAPDSAGALAYRQLAREFLRREEGSAAGQDAGKRSERWWRRLPMVTRLFGQEE